MKKGYKRLLLFCLFLFIILLFNTFIFNIFNGYKISIFLLIILFIFNKIFIIEKDNHLYFKDVLIEIIIFVVGFFLIYYLLGFVVGLAKTGNYWTINSFKDIIIPLVLYIILREIFRYNMLLKSDNNMLCTVIVILLFILLDVTNTIYFTNFSTKINTFRFIALSLLPALSKNISYSIISKKMGYKGIIVFDLIFSLYLYLIPILPNVNEYLISIVYLVIPIIFAYRIIKYFELKSNNALKSDYHKIKIKGLIIPLLIVIVLVYFYSGYFKYYAIAIATGSMEPNINKGDIVIVDQKAKKYKLKDVIAVKKDNVIIVHRLAKVVKISDSYFYYTKGDANNNMDDFVIEEDMIIGKVKFRLPFVGYPTVWFNEK